MEESLILFLHTFDVIFLLHSHLPSEENGFTGKTDHYKN